MTHTFPHDGSDVIDGLSDLAKVPAVPHVAPHQYTEEGDVETNDCRLRERLHAQHVQDARDEVGGGHDREEDSRRAVGVQYVLALVAFEERLVRPRYLLL